MNVEWKFTEKDKDTLPPVAAGCFQQMPIATLAFLIRKET
jgi:hypothetical protein